MLQEVQPALSPETAIGVPGRSHYFIAADRLSPSTKLVPGAGTDGAWSPIPLTCCKLLTCVISIKRDLGVGLRDRKDCRVELPSCLIGEQRGIQSYLGHEFARSIPS